METFYKNTNTKHIKNSFSTAVRGNYFLSLFLSLGGLYTLATLNLLKCGDRQRHIFSSILKGTEVTKIYTNKFYFFLVLIEIGRRSALTCLELNRCYCR